MPIVVKNEMAFSCVHCILCIPDWEVTVEMPKAQASRWNKLCKQTWQSLRVQSAWGHTLQLFSIYFARDFKWEPHSRQFKEWSHRSQGFVARTRGLTHATVTTLESQLQACIDLARNLVRIPLT